MADKTLHLTVITPARAVLDTPAAAVVAPAFDGELGVLPGHASMLALLGTGLLRVTLAGGATKRLAIHGGFLQIDHDQVTVLTQESLASEEIKPEALQAEAAKLSAQNPTKMDERDALETSQQWLKARQRALETTSSARH